METFAPPRELAAHPQFGSERQQALQALDMQAIDAPIRDLIAALAALEHVFTLQCCFGHFVHAEEPDPHSLQPLRERDVGPITYRIAYLAFCIENSEQGRRFLGDLAEIPAVDPDFVQFGSPTWFWERHPNSYALQVEPMRFADRDQAPLEYREALQVQEVRGRFFARVAEVVGSEVGR